MLANPLLGVDVSLMKSQGLVVPLWEQGETFQLIAFLSHTKKFTEYSISTLERDNLLLMNVDNLIFDNKSYEEMKFNLNIRRPGYDDVLSKSNEKVRESKSFQFPPSRIETAPTARRRSARRRASVSRAGVAGRK